MKRLVLLTALCLAASAWADSTCKASNPDDSELVAEMTIPDKSCVKAMMEKVKEAKCAAPEAGGTKVEYMLHTKNAKGEYPAKGTKQTVTCPKAKKGAAPAAAPDAGP